MNEPLIPLMFTLALPAVLLRDLYLFVFRTCRAVERADSSFFLQVEVHHVSHS
jgi:hypothetical protein